eukprot:scaffold112323_cov37-Prasinocladus_malaysianus.AAC.1
MEADAPGSSSHAQTQTTDDPHTAGGDEAIGELQDRGSEVIESDAQEFPRSTESGISLPIENPEDKTDSTTIVEAEVTVETIQSDSPTQLETAAELPEKHCQADIATAAPEGHTHPLAGEAFADLTAGSGLTAPGGVLDAEKSPLSSASGGLEADQDRPEGEQSQPIGDSDTAADTMAEADAGQVSSETTEVSQLSRDIAGGSAEDWRQGSVGTPASPGKESTVSANDQSFGTAEGGTDDDEDGGEAQGDIGA